jgi:hypothetical protein
MTAFRSLYERAPPDTTPRPKKISYADLSDPDRAVRGEGTGGSHPAPADESELDMTTTTLAPTHRSLPPSTPSAARQPLWKHGVTAAAVAALATTVLAAIASGAGVSFADSTGESIPIAAFPQLTLFCSLIGVGIAALMARKARRPRSTFVRTAVSLTVLSFVPDLTFGFDAASAATLISLHTVAAAIVVPTIASRLSATR